MKNRTGITGTLILAVVLVIVAAALLIGEGSPADVRQEPEPPRTLILATTTSTYDSGLLDYIIPDFEQRHNAEVQVLSLGTGQALKTGESGDADVLLVHAPESELLFVEQGYGIGRRCVMYNDFIIIGPEDDPAVIRGRGVVEALAAIDDEGMVFISRGDDSGTHKKELSLWAEAGIDPGGDWYQEVGAGMGDTILIAGEKEAYTMADRATYIAYKDKTDLVILVEGDPTLINQYGVILVNPALHGNIEAEAARDFSDWLMSEETQTLIGSFTKGGERLFFPLRGECVAG
ncbi:substrate-binding domain-containing protein [Candidatus Woesearchaeota archaeon]|nr:substrate-binding domain-containing protein [Candidatus Woesearchaeota archaeon]